jgi:hypothetical protein
MRGKNNQIEIGNCLPALQFRYLIQSYSHSNSCSRGAQALTLTFPRVARTDVLHALEL